MQALVFKNTKEKSQNAEELCSIPIITCSVAKSSRTFEVGEVRGICDEQTNLQQELLNDTKFLPLELEALSICSCDWVPE